MGDIMFTISAGLAVILCIIPGFVHIQTRNHGAIFMTLWVIITNFIVFVNSLLWPDNTNLEDKAPIWCLIASPLYVGTNFGLLSSSACTIYTMYTYVSAPIILTVKVKRRQAIRAFMATIVFPAIFMGLFYIVQVNKYSIRPVIGCTGLAQHNWVFFLVNNMWPPLIALIGCYYAGNLLCFIMFHHFVSP
jgi:pheromone a factor receptor